jgi:hypothetical protein
MGSGVHAAPSNKWSWRRKRLKPRGLCLTEPSIPHDGENAKNRVALPFFPF